MLLVAGGLGAEGPSSKKFLHALKKRGFPLYKIVMHLNFSAKLQNTALKSG